MPPNENRARHARLEILFARRVWVGTEQGDMHPAPGIVLSETKTVRHYSVSAIVRVCREERGDMSPELIEFRRGAEMIEKPTCSRRNCPGSTAGVRMLQVYSTQCVSRKDTWIGRPCYDFPLTHTLQTPQQMETRPWYVPISPNPVDCCICMCMCECECSRSMPDIPHGDSRCGR